MPSIHKKFLDDGIRFLGSLKLSFVLLVLLLLLLSKRALISHRFALAEGGDHPPYLLSLLARLGSASPDLLNPLFLVIMLLFIVNLGFAGILMVRATKRKNRLLARAKKREAILALPNHAVFSCSSNPEPLLTGFFTSNGFRVIRQQTGDTSRLCAIKRQAGRWGVCFFHLAFFVVLAGALLSLLTRYSGYVELSPDETFVEKRDNYRLVDPPPLLFAGDRYFQFTLEDIELSYWQPGEVKRRASVISLAEHADREPERKRLAVNRPLDIGDMTIYQGSRHGYVVELLATDRKGTEAKGNLHFRIPAEPSQSLSTTARLPGTTLVLFFELFTDRLAKIPGLESMALRHPASLLKVYSVSSGKKHFRGVIFEGGSLEVEGLALSFQRLDPYTSFVIVRDYGVPVIFAGFGFLLAGLLVTYFWVPEIYWATIHGRKGSKEVTIGAVTEKYKASFQERFSTEVAEIRKRIGHAQ